MLAGCRSSQRLFGIPAGATFRIPKFEILGPVSGAYDSTLNPAHSFIDAWGVPSTMPYIAQHAVTCRIIGTKVSLVN